jgi:hypothetical protein
MGLCVYVLGWCQTFFLASDVWAQFCISVEHEKLCPYHLSWCFLNLTEPRWVGRVQNSCWFTNNMVLVCVCTRVYVVLGLFERKMVMWTIMALHHCNVKLMDVRSKPPLLLLPQELIMASQYLVFPFSIETIALSQDPHLWLYERMMSCNSTFMSLVIYDTIRRTLPWPNARTCACNRQPEFKDSPQIIDYGRVASPLLFYLFLRDYACALLDVNFPFRKITYDNMW